MTRTYTRTSNVQHIGPYRAKNLNPSAANTFLYDVIIYLKSHQASI